MTIFLAPYTAIADIDGSPLDAGFLFFGEYGKDPELFPIEVFWDADFTVPAAQPIRTRNGYPVRNGSPTKVYLKTVQHSIVIKNRNSASILVDFKNKGWSADFIVDASGETQQAINDGLVGAATAPDIAAGKKLRVIAGTIRNTGTGWEWISDASHTPLGFNPTITIVNETLKIDYGFLATKVVSLIAVPDESFAIAGLRVGTSVALDNTLLSMFAPFNFRTSGTAVAAGNFLESGVDFTTTFDINAGTCVVTHPTLSHVDSQGGAISIQNTSLDGNQVVIPTDPSKTGFTLKYTHPVGGRINGTSITSENVGTTATWDNVDTLTITHPACGASTQDVSLVAESSGHLPICTGSTATTITVQFRDYAGALYTGTTTPAVFRYIRGGRAISKISGGTKLQVSRGLVKVRPSKVTSSNGNIWIYGVMEV